MIITVIGARPNFIKIDTDLNQSLLHTGQHYDYTMNGVFFKELKIPKPRWNLNCRGNEIGKMIDKMSKLFAKEKPSLIQVFGDTNSALAGALAGAYNNIPIAHVEAGLRSHRLDMPEEINRVLIDRISTVRFCPNSYSEINLLKEGIKDGVYITGDPSFDTFGQFLPIPKSKNYKEYILLTLHRNFNSDNIEKVKSVLSALGESKEKVLFPIHPRTKKNISKFKLKIPSNIKPCSPKSYSQTLHLISNAKKVVTDSGGIQREAFWMSVPVIILREETEWTDIISSRAGLLTGTDKDKILDAIKTFKGKVNAPPIFGAKKRIKEILFKYV